MEPIFSNSTTSWAETLAEISMVIGENYDDIHDKIDDSREINSLAIKWANDFEEKNKGREWDGEWLDEVLTFVTDRIREIKNS